MPQVMMLRSRATMPFGASGWLETRLVSSLRVQNQ